MRETLSIWWFAGLLLLAYGVIILLTGVWELSHPLLHPPVLNRLHPAIWWGGGLTLCGLGYCARYWPKRSGRR